MYRGRNGKVARLALCTGVGLALSGCVQATRHSNAIVFGTNTSMGINVGTGAASVPGINIGYNRQEAVFLPLLANTRDLSEVSQGRNRQLGALQPLLTPCNIDPTDVLQTVLNRTKGVPAQPVRNTQNDLSPDEIATLARSSSANPCLFVARSYDANGRVAISDAYSVFASFGGRAGGGQGSAPNASLGIAQYFATGAAAQQLTQRSGGSVTGIGSPPANTGTAGRAEGQTSSPATPATPANPAIPGTPPIPATPNATPTDPVPPPAAAPPPP